MIDEGFRFNILARAKDPVLASISWNIVDWDQRKTFSVVFNGELDSETFAVDCLRRHVDNLGPDVNTIEVSHEGELVNVSSKPEDDKTIYFQYPLLQDIEKSSIQKPTSQRPRIRSVFLTELYELDRLRRADLVSYRGRKLAFKYFFLFDQSELLWAEINALMQLPPHPNIISLHRVVVEKLYDQEHIVGFTTRYIPGGDLAAKGRRVFKFKWLEQLISVINDLNLKYGIQHGDIAPRNTLVDEATDNIILIDFNVSVRVDPPIDSGSAYKYLESYDVNGAIFTVYEIITRDYQLRGGRDYGRRDISDVMNMDWVQHPDVRLNKPLAAYKAMLEAWVVRRRDRKTKGITDNSNYISWPNIPKSTRHGFSRGELISKKLQVIKWNRPAQDKIKEGMCVLADGTVIKTSSKAWKSPR